MARRTTTHQDRIEMIELHQKGLSFAEIAQRFGVHRDTVRGWWRQFQQGGWSALLPRPAGRPATGPLGSFDPLIKYAALRLKREHPHWGPDVIRCHLARRSSLVGLAIPSRSALAAYVKPYIPRVRHPRRLPIQRPDATAWRPQAPHEWWQMDFKGDEQVGPCGPVAPFLVTDVWTSAPLAAIIHSAPISSSVVTRDVQANLRQVFTRWGLPDAIRMDRGAIFIGGPRFEWPGTLILWLVGLGVYPLINDPGHPRQNACVERQNRTWKDHVAVGASFTNLADVQAATDNAWADRLAHLPSRNPRCNGLPPLIACPELAIPRRSFSPEIEPSLFDFERVELYLADWRWPRKVDQCGKISLANVNIPIDKTRYKQCVEVIYDLTAHAFCAISYDDPRTVIRTFQHSRVEPNYIMGISGG